MKGGFPGGFGKTDWLPLSGKTIFADGGHPFLYANEMKDPTPYNERQEFLGDAVLSIVVSDYLFKNSSLAEGDLTKLRAALVCENACAASRPKSTWVPPSGWARGKR